MNIYRLFEQCEGLAIGQAIRTSVWLFPVIEATHLLALALLGGAVLILDLRLLGTGLTSQPASRIERQTRPWLVGALIGLIATGVPLFLSEALKLYDSQAFWLKMALLLAALLFTFAIRNPFARRDPGDARLSRAVALISMGLWFGVALAGRWIGFS